MQSRLSRSTTDSEKNYCSKQKKRKKKKNRTKNNSPQTSTDLRGDRIPLVADDGRVLVSAFLVF